MKHSGCILEFTTQRNNELMAAFRKALGCQYSSDIEIYELTVNSPSSRFWVSEERATIVISAICRGVPVLEKMNPLKREMFSEIYKRVLVLKKSNPDARLYDLVFDIVNSPAPKFYMQPRSAKEIIYKIKKGHYNSAGKNINLY